MMELAQTMINACRLLWHFIQSHYLATLMSILQMIEKHNKPELKRKDGHVAIVTGGARGIGLEVVRQLLSVGYHVIIGCRSQPKDDVVLKDLRETYPDCKVEIISLDLASIISVRKFATKFQEKNLPLHLLVNNAGVMFVPYQVTEDGFEYHFGTNYLGHALLTHVLLPKLITTGRESDCYSRVVNVSSCVQYVGTIRFGDVNSRIFYSPYAGYAQSKLAQVMFTRSLDEKLSEEGIPVTVNSLHPGVIWTDLYQHIWYISFVSWLFKLVFKTTEQGADGIMFLANSAKLEKDGGKYFENCIEKVPNSEALDRRSLNLLWEQSCRLLGITENWLETKN